MVEESVLLSSLRNLILQRDRVRELKNQADDIAFNIDTTVNMIAELTEQGSDKRVETLMSDAAPVMADAILETLNWLNWDFGSISERKRCSRLLQNALSKATGTNGAATGKEEE